MSKKIADELGLHITRATRTVYFFVAFYCISIIVFDAGNLFTSDVILKRWSLAMIVLAVNTVVWFMNVRQGKTASLSRPYLLWVLTLSLIGLAGYMTYLERGMASTSTILYVLPLLTIALMKNRHALMATTTLSAATYGYAAVKYFTDFFNEGYRIQLWGTILLTTTALFVTSWLIMILAGLRHDSI